MTVEPWSAAPGPLFLSGPPFGGDLFEAVCARFGRGQTRCILEFGENWQEAGANLAALGGPPRVLVGHGLAVPAVVEAALRRPPAALVLSNGPLRTLDPVTGALRRVGGLPAGGPLLKMLMSRALWLAWLRSSLGLRRAVVNPYVMDRDTVAALCGPLVSDAEGRTRAVSWLGSLSDLPDARSLRCPTLILWGDADPLYPATEASFAEAVIPGARYVAVPGGQHLHPVERPWEMADRLHAWLGDQGIGGRA